MTARVSMRDLRTLLIKLDGVLYVEDAPIAGALEAVAALRSRGLALRFVTNTTTLRVRRILERLNHLGWAVEADELATPAALAVARCRECGDRRVVLLMNDAVKADFHELEEGDEQVDAVIVGDLGEAFSALEASGVTPTAIVDSITDVPRLCSPPAERL